MTYNTSYYKQKSKELRDVLVSFRLKKTAIEVVYLQKGFDKMGATINEASDAFIALQMGVNRIEMPFSRLINKNK